MMLAPISPHSKCCAASIISTKRARTKASMVTFTVDKHFLRRLHFASTVRNRAKELVELLADVDKIRQERKRAKSNRTKYVGSGNDGYSGGGRYGGFGNESYGGGGYSGDYGSNASGYDRGGFRPLFLMK